MICHCRTKRFIILRYTKSLVRLVVCWEKSIEQAMKLAFADETDVPNLNRTVLFSWARFPQGVSETRIRFSELLAISVKVRQRGGH
jgi:hypothetical protein